MRRVCTVRPPANLARSRPGTVDAGRNPVDNQPRSSRTLCPTGLRPVADRIASGID